MANEQRKPERSTDMASTILVEATHLFAARGYDGTSVQAIADAVGIRKASLLYHYASKEALHRRVLEELLSQWNDRLPALMLAASTSRDRFDAVIHAGVEFFIADLDRARLLMREMLDRPDEMRHLVSTHSTVWVKAMSDALREGQQGGRVHKDLDPEAYVIHVVNMVCGLAAMLPLATLLEQTTGAAANRDAALERYVEELQRIARVALFVPRPPRPSVESLESSTDLTEK